MPYDQGLEHGPRDFFDNPASGDPGLIFGRDIWQREHDESLRFVARLRELLEKYPA